MEPEDDSREQRIAAFLVPLDGLRPAGRPNRKARAVRGALAVGLGVLVIGGGVATATSQFGVLHDTTSEATDDPVGCAVGMSAEEADEYFASQGYERSWRFETFEAEYAEPPGEAHVNENGVTVQEPGMVEGHSEVRASPPPNTVVEDVIRQGSEVIVFVQAEGDPNAPQVGEPRC